MSRYELYAHAGEITYADWQTVGIKLPVFDKDGTLTSCRDHELVDEVVEGMKRQQLPDIYRDIVMISNNHCSQSVRYSAARLERALGVTVHTLCQADGFRRKPHPEMGLVVAQRLGVAPSELGVVGDRWYCDARFGYNLGAGAIALCRRAGQGDRMGMPIVRAAESIAVAIDRRLGRVGRFVN